MAAFGPRPGTGMGPHEQFYNATTMIGFAEPTPRFFGSGFFVANVVEPHVFVTDDSATMFLVTARHVIASAIFDQRALCVRIGRFSAEPTTIDLPIDGWIFSENCADIAILPLPQLKSALVEGGIGIPVISPGQFFVEDWRSNANDYRFGDLVRALGLWYGSTTYPQLIVRSGNIATATVGAVQFESGAVPAYLADVNVTRAMSGGPVYATRGRGWDESTLIGVTYGYWPTDLETVDVERSAAETVHNRAMQALRTEVERLNSRLAIVTPIHHVAEMLIMHPLW